MLCGLIFACGLPAAGPALVLGIAGGWEPAEAPWAMTTRVNALLALAAPEGTELAAVGNHHLEDAREIIEEFRKRHPKGRLIFYGQSMGGAATLKLCRWLDKQQVPVRLNVQIDSVGVRDGVVPANVEAAANLYQRDFGPIRGQAKIKAKDPARTKILGNWRYSYPPGKVFDTSGMPLGHKLILNPHLKMEFDPEVHAKVVALILEALRD